jgi:hypothetical protein
MGIFIPHPKLSVKRAPPKKREKKGKKVKKGTGTACMAARMTRICADFHTGFLLFRENPQSRHFFHLFRAFFVSD